MKYLRVDDQELIYIREALIVLSCKLSGELALLTKIDAVLNRPADIRERWRQKEARRMLTPKGRADKRARDARHHAKVRAAKIAKREAYYSSDPLPYDTIERE